MAQPVPSQHPAVVLRSPFNKLRALLAVALIAVIGLTLAVVILANNDGQTAGTRQAAPIGHINYGDFNPNSGRPDSAPLPKRETAAPITGRRYHGAPKEGTLGIRPASVASGVASPRTSETPGTAAARRQVEIGRSITDPDAYLAYVKSLADYDNARDYGDKR